ncbi:MAG: RagB/SusD family nutrient uptake outer membrane protein [Chitinophagaceae bacterium]
MKQLKYKGLLALAALVLLAASCSKKGTDFLDQTETGNLNEALTFSDSIRTMEFLTGLYQGIPNFYRQTSLTNYGSLADCTDEGELIWSGTGNYPITINNGVLAPGYAWVTNTWSHWYSRIRNAAIFLKNINNTPLSPDLRRRTSGEARFMRAWYYHQLLRFYGGTPLLGDSVYSPSDLISLPRNTYAECVDYLVSELDAVAEILPPFYEGADYGRVTKGAAMALKARVLLYAASPLQNGGYNNSDGFTATDEQKALVSYPAYDENRWKKAADAYKAVMDLNLYGLYEDPANTTPGYGFYKMFLLRMSNEAIFQIMQGNNTTLESIWFPKSRSGQSATYPSQQLVDAFPMKTGVPINDPTSGYDPNDPYVNRDPRFYYTILYNGAMFRGNSTVAQSPVWTFQGSAPDGMGQASATRTGYYCRKMISNEATGNTQRSIPEIRYAEVLLSYAEALNEYAGPTQEVYDAVEAIRERAGLSPYQLPAGLSKEEMRSWIHAERRVELAYENHRYFDTRRWKIAHDPEVVILRGLRWVKDGSDFKREDIVAEARAFNHPAMYYFPIPQAEMGRQPLFVQNPGY